jgi:hypothetical protein
MRVEPASIPNGTIYSMIISGTLWEPLPSAIQIWALWSPA